MTKRKYYTVIEKLPQDGAEWAPQFGDYQEKTERIIPLVRLTARP